MKAPKRNVTWLLAGSASILVLGAFSAAVRELRGLNCADIRYDRRYFCTEQFDTVFWLGSAYGAGYALIAWIAALFLVPVLVAYKTRSNGWAFVAYLLVLVAALTGELGVRSLVRLEDSEMLMQRQNDASTAIGALFCGFFLTLMASSIAADISRGRS